MSVIYWYPEWPYLVEHPWEVGAVGAVMEQRMTNIAWPYVVPVPIAVMPPVGHGVGQAPNGKNNTLITVGFVAALVAVGAYVYWRYMREGHFVGYWRREFDGPFATVEEAEERKELLKGAEGLRRRVRATDMTVHRGYTRAGLEF